MGKMRAAIKADVIAKLQAKVKTETKELAEMRHKLACQRRIAAEYRLLWLSNAPDKGK